MRRNLCFIIIVSLSILLIAYGRVLASYGYEAPENAEGSKSLVLAALNLREGVFPWNMEKQDTHPMVAMQTPVQLNLDSTDAGDSTDGVAESESNPVPAAEGDDTTTTVTSSGDAGETETAANEGGGSDEDRPLRPGDEGWPPEFITVDEDYFSDALFIGDSRVVGLWAYAPIEGATYYGRTAMTISNMFSCKVETNDEVKTVQEGLENHQFAKVYIKVGINEIGTGNTEYFVSNYRERILELQMLQPQALFYIQGIMHVDAHKNATERYINNTLINERNEGLRALAEEVGAIYLDINEVYDDENGCLPSDMTGDGVHLYAQCYTPWHDYLLTHAIPWEADLPEESAPGAKK